MINKHESQASKSSVGLLVDRETGTASHTGLRTWYRECLNGDVGDVGILHSKNTTVSRCW